MSPSFVRSAALVAALAALSQTGAAARAPAENAVVAKVECREARYPVGTALTGDEVVGKENRGEVKAIDRIRYAPGARTVGFLYTTREGRVFVTDRPAAALQTADLAIMNELVEAMGYVRANAFDPRDNGFIYYELAWRPRLATAMHLHLARCPAAG